MLNDAMTLVRVACDRPSSAARAELRKPPRKLISAPPPPARVCLLDGFSLHVRGRDVILRNCKARALIAYLLLARGMRETRERLIGLLWSETEEVKARASLRQLVHLLRENLEEAGVVGFFADKAQVGLDSTLFATDLHELTTSIDADGPEDHFFANEAFEESILRGYDDVDPAFGSWLSIKRETIRQFVVRKLETRLADAEPQSKVGKRVAAALFRVDPTHESACQALMRASMAAGNVGGALAAYKQLWERLADEYDVEPSGATQELVVAIKNGSYRLAEPTTCVADELKANAEQYNPVLLLAVRLAIAWTSASAIAKDGHHARYGDLVCHQKSLLRLAPRSPADNSS